MILNTETQSYSPLSCAAKPRTPCPPLIIFRQTVTELVSLCLVSLLDDPFPVSFPVFPFQQATFYQRGGHSLNGSERFADMCCNLSLSSFGIVFEEFQQGNLIQSAIQSVIWVL